RNSKKTSTVAVVETKTDDDVAGKVSTLVTTASNGGKVSHLKPSSQKFVSTAN
ncbi:hypothetical protein FCV25MIE_28970, partial [Fagus crenata]